MPCGQKSRFQYKNWLVAPNIKIFRSKLHIFVSSGQLEPHRSMFSTRKRCLIGSLKWGSQDFYSVPKKMGCWPKNGQNWPKTGIFGRIRAFLAHLVPCPTKKQCEQGFHVVFPLRGCQNFCFLLVASTTTWNSTTTTTILAIAGWAGIFPAFSSS